jgi:hypothetical protein
MHVILTPAAETKLEIRADNGRRYILTFKNGEAFVPLHIAEFLVRNKLATRGERNDPVAFERLPGGAHGRAINPYDAHVVEVTS